MACHYCEKAVKEDDVYSIPSSMAYEGIKNVRKCPVCQQRWWCYNDHFNLWTTVDDDFTWEVIKRNIDIPISISKPAVVLPGYDDYSISPDHIPLKNEVIRPTISFEKIIDEETATLQWVGEYKGQFNILRCQFYFPILSDLSQHKDIIDSFHVPFIGKVENWPDPEQRDMLLANGSFERGKTIIHLISSKACNQDSDPPTQFSGIVTTVLLADPCVGVIEPQPYYNPHICSEAISLFKEKQSQ